MRDASLLPRRDGRDVEVGEARLELGLSGVGVDVVEAGTFSGKRSGESLH